MLEDIFSIHQEVMKNIPKGFSRYLFSKINWSSMAICILGDRGVGKTTLICQHLLAKYQTPNRALYLSADNLKVVSFGLFNIARDFFSNGGEALYIDEIHKYPKWSFEIKNILDTYKTKQVIFSGSSSLDLKKSKGDLSRRVIYHRLPGLSFREYLLLAHQIEVPQISLEMIIAQHVELASRFSTFPILKFFQEYIAHGYYPFFLEGTSEFYLKLNNVVEKVLFEDVAVVYNLKQSTLPVLKKVIWLVATSNGMIPNIDKMSKNLGVSRELIYNCLHYLESSGLLSEVYSSNRGNALVRKPGKIYVNNTNLLQSIHGELKLGSDQGALRETFFVNQLSVGHRICLHEKGDFIVEGKFVFEIGGRGKTPKQIRGLDKAYLALDGIDIGFGKKIPLYLFGLLY